MTSITLVIQSVDHTNVSCDHQTQYSRSGVRVHDYENWSVTPVSISYCQYGNCLAHTHPMWLIKRYTSETCERERKKPMIK
jgi:hypothetical protein